MTIFDSIWDETSAEHLDVARATFDTQKDIIEEMVKTAVNAIESGNKIILFGNGGSAADAQHIAAEMSVKLKQSRKPIAAISLSMDASTLTACGNDFGFDHIFERQIWALGKEGDIAIGLTTSGTSANILKALETAQSRGLETFGWTGKSGGGLPEHCDHILQIPSTNTARIQEMHITMGHIFVGALEEQLELV